MRETNWIGFGDARFKASLKPDGRATVTLAPADGPIGVVATTTDPLDLDRLIATLADLRDGLVAILCDDAPVVLWDGGAAHAACDWEEAGFDGSGVAS